jgi:hypothetical protein
VHYYGNFNADKSRTKITASPDATEVRFAIWQNNALIQELANATFEKGGHILRFDSLQLPNGVYYYGIVTADQETKKRMTISN